MVLGYFKDVSGEIQDFPKGAFDTSHVTYIIFEFLMTSEKNIYFTFVLRIVIFVSQRLALHQINVEIKWLHQNLSSFIVYTMNVSREFQGFS